ncbi:gluconolactonase [Rhodobacteraceae bacterium WD3A24]|nr:gluconolactonase [Rhodobacteraceae bacterium WD3A24]
MTARIFDDRACELGEGPLWHPLRETLFWFDIPGRRMLARGADGPAEWQFDEMHSAAAWLDHDRLLLASESGLWRFDIPTGSRTRLCGIEADNPLTRSNDGRADPQGGFWIGTMGKQAESGAGAIWRWYRGELRRLFGEMTIPNAICFPPGGRFAHFTDTATRQIMKVALDENGWPADEPDVFLDLSAEALNPDGAVIDADGVLWVAQWGAARIAAYGPDGRFQQALYIDAPNVSCPAFGGEDLATLHCTTAQEGLTPEQLTEWSRSGCTFAAAGVSRGQREHRVLAS